jgi:hypothetical protein
MHLVKAIATFVLMSALETASTPYTMTTISPGWVNISWHTSVSTAAIKVYRDDRLAQTSAIQSDYDVVWTFHAYAGQRITVVEYADRDASVEVRRFTTDPVDAAAGHDPKTYIPLVTVSL